MDDKVEVVREGALMRVRFNRPAKLNALDTDVLADIAEIFTEANRDFSLKAIVLTGNGRAFSAGADRKSPPGSERMSGKSGASERERRHASQIGLRACSAIANCEVPTVAGVHGWCVGGGVALALSCDFRIASRDAKFSIPEVDLGIPLAWGAAPRLMQEIGAARARQLILMCDTISADEADRFGLVHRVVDEDLLDDELNDWAGRLMSKPEIAVHETKTQFRAYSQRSTLGAVTETDGDLMVQASRGDFAKQAFGSYLDE